MKTLRTLELSVMVTGAIALIPSATVLAQEVAPSYKASPEIYKVIAENEQMVVILATWPAGIKDNMHSHPKSHAAYSLTDCHRKITKDDGTADEKHLKAGSARIAAPIKAHTFENLGNVQCQAVLVELK